MENDFTGVSAPVAGEQSGVVVPDAGGQSGEILENVADSQVVEPRTVPLEALTSERQKRQDYERKLALIERENEYLRQERMQVPAAPEKPEYAPDDFLTAGQVESLFQKRLQAQEAKFREREIQVKVAQVKSKYADFDQVVEDAVQMCYDTDDPQAAIVALKNAGPEFAYRFGKSHPRYTQAQNIQSNKQLFDQMDKNQSRPGTLADAGGGTPANLTFEEKFKRMSREQREEHYKRVRDADIQYDISKGFS